MKSIASMYTCRNAGQVALRWSWESAPTGPGWVDVKSEPLIRLSDVERLRSALREIRDNSDDLSACEMAADALNDSEK